MTAFGAFEYPSEPPSFDKLLTFASFSFFPLFAIVFSFFSVLSALDGLGLGCIRI